MKKWIAMVLAVGMLLTLCVGCENGTDQQANQEPEAETRLFTDSAGRKMKVPAEITRVAVTGPNTQIIVFALAPDQMVGIAEEWEPAAKQYFEEDYCNLPILGQLYGGKGEMNLEELLNANPQVVIDVGEPKDTIVEDLDKLSTQTGIPFVHITATLQTMDEAYTKLGELLGMEEQAAVLTEYCHSVYERIKDISNRVDKIDMLYITGQNGLNVIAKDSYHSEVMDFLSNNVAVLEQPSSKGTGNEVDFEQILNWNPSYIMFAPDSIYEKVENDSNWKTLAAIQNESYCEVPEGPYNWMGFPPSVQRFLGMMWMASVLYPQEADFDLYQEVKNYFKLFYHCDITREAYDVLVANSIGK